MPSCGSCGAELAPNAAFCSACGAAVAAAPTPPPTAPLAAPATAAVAVTDVNAWAMWSHLSAIGGLIFPFGNIIAPLIIWLTKRDEIPEVDRNGKEALNFQITMSGISVILWGVSAFFTIGSAFLPKESGSTLMMLFGGLESLAWLAIVIVWITFVTQASIAAHKGEDYTYRYSLEIVK